MKLLLVEDDGEIRDMLCQFLEGEPYEVACAANGEAACRMFDGDAFDLVLLDLMLPGQGGFDVLRHIRRTSTVPVLILSARDTGGDKILGLGADDYITKPLSVAELLARIKANLRRSTQYAAQAAPAQERLTAGELVMDLSGHTVTKAGEPVELTAKEFDILKLLLQHPKIVYTKGQIYRQVWKDAYLGDENAVNVHISRLRSKLEDDSRHPRYIVTVWGVGYKLGKQL